MKNALKKIGPFIFSVLIIIAMAGGIIVFSLFTIAIIVGGESGSTIALLVKNTIMPFFIRCAAIAMAGGLIVLYASGEHELTLGDDK